MVSHLLCFVSRLPYNKKSYLNLLSKLYACPGFSASRLCMDKVATSHALKDTFISNLKVEHFQYECPTYAHYFCEAEFNENEEMLLCPTTLQEWQIEPPVNHVIDRLENYFDKIKGELDTLDRTKDEDVKKFKSQKIHFDFSILIRIKELMVDVSSKCKEVALKLLKHPGVVHGCLSSMGQLYVLFKSEQKGLKCHQCKTLCTLRDVRLLYATRLCILDAIVAAHRIVANQKASTRCFPYSPSGVSYMDYELGWILHASNKRFDVLKRGANVLEHNEN
ncbi:formin-like protein 5 [Tanacetum coccineum]